MVTTLTRDAKVAAIIPMLLRLLSGNVQWMCVLIMSVMVYGRWEQNQHDMFFYLCCFAESWATFPVVERAWNGCLSPGTIRAGEPVFEVHPRRNPVFVTEAPGFVQTQCSMAWLGENSLKFSCRRVHCSHMLKFIRKVTSCLWLWSKHLKSFLTSNNLPLDIARALKLHNLNSFHC